MDVFKCKVSCSRLLCGGKGPERGGIRSVEQLWCAGSVRPPALSEHHWWWCKGNAVDFLQGAGFVFVSSAKGYLHSLLAAKSEGFSDTGVAVQWCLSHMGCAPRCVYDLAFYFWAKQWCWHSSLCIRAPAASGGSHCVPTGAHVTQTSCWELRVASVCRNSTEMATGKRRRWGFM